MLHGSSLPKMNWWQVDWDKFHKHLTQQLNELPTLSEISTLEDFDCILTNLITAINTTAAATVPITNPSLFVKRWWIKDLSQACLKMRHSARSLNKVENDPTHPSHQEYQLHRNTYANLIWLTKKKHWIEWLEEANKSTIWSANRLISGPSTDGGSTRIPALTTTSNAGHTSRVTSNEHKSSLLFKVFFPSQGVLLQQNPMEENPLLYSSTSP